MAGFISFATIFREAKRIYFSLLSVSEVTNLFFPYLQSLRDDAIPSNSSSFSC